MVHLLVHGRDARKPVSRISTNVKPNPVCLARENRYTIEILHRTSLTNILSRKLITKTLIRMRECAGWSAHLLFACNKIRVSSDEAILYLALPCTSKQFFSN